MSKYNSPAPFFFFFTYDPKDDDIENYPDQFVFQDGIIGEDPIALRIMVCGGGANNNSKLSVQFQLFNKDN